MRWLTRAVTTAGETVTVSIEVVRVGTGDAHRAGVLRTVA